MNTNAAAVFARLASILRSGEITSFTERGVARDSMGYPVQADDTSACSFSAEGALESLYGIARASLETKSEARRVFAAVRDEAGVELSAADLFDRCARLVVEPVPTASARRAPGATRCGRWAEPAADLCAACANQITRQTRERGETMKATKIVKRRASGVDAVARFPAELVAVARGAAALDVADIIDRLYEVAVGNVTPATYGFADLAEAEEVLQKSTGPQGKSALLRARAVREDRAARAAAPRSSRSSRTARARHGRPR